MFEALLIGGLLGVLSIVVDRRRKRGKFYDDFSERVKVMDKLGPLNDPLAAYYALKAGAALEDKDFEGCEEALSKAERYHAEAHSPFGDHIHFSVDDGLDGSAWRGHDR